MNVIGFTVAGDQPAIHGLADLTEMPGKPVQCGAIEYAASILGDTDQMHGKKRNATALCTGQRPWPLLIHRVRTAKEMSVRLPDILE